MDNGGSCLVDLTNLVLSVSMHVDGHAIVSTTEIISDTPIHIDSNILGLHAQSIADESMAMAHNDVEISPPVLMQRDQLSSETFLTFDWIWARIDDNRLLRALRLRSVTGNLLADEVFTGCGTTTHENLH